MRVSGVPELKIRRRTMTGNGSEAFGVYIGGSLHSVAARGRIKDLYGQLSDLDLCNEAVNTKSSM